MSGSSAWSMEADKLERSVWRRKIEEANNHPGAWAEFLNAERVKAARGTRTPDGPGGLSRTLLALFKEATEKMSVELHRNNGLLIDIWLEYARLCNEAGGSDDATSVYRRMRTSKIGLRSAKFYVGLADCELERGSLEAAKNTIATGMSLNAQPADLLVDYLENLPSHLEPGSRSARPSNTVPGANIGSMSVDGRALSVQSPPAPVPFNDKENVPPRQLREPPEPNAAQETAVPLRSAIAMAKPVGPGGKESSEAQQVAAISSTPSAVAGEELVSSIDAMTIKTPRADHEDRTSFKIGSGASRDSGTSEPASSGLQSRLRRLDRKRLGPPKRHVLLGTDGSPQSSGPDSDSPESDAAAASSEVTPLKIYSETRARAGHGLTSSTGATHPVSSGSAVLPDREPEQDNATVRHVPSTVSSRHNYAQDEQPALSAQAMGDPSATVLASHWNPEGGRRVSPAEDTKSPSGDQTINQALAAEPPRPPAALSRPADRPPLPTPPLQRTVLNPKTHIEVNGVIYARLEVIGRGGSSKVYKLMAADGKQYALKKVNLKTADQFATEGYRNEISLLQKLRKNERIIRLIDAEMNEDFILMVMELGEVDLATLMKREQGNLSINFIRMYWEQMLQAVHAIHEENIIHTDLKPANFLLVEGSLKLIDFGIAKSIPNDTTNIHREHQTGTVNYMSPESITDMTGSKRQYLKLGRPSDVWSLGCILYQMVFGQPPFGSITSMIKKLHAIVDPEFAIPFPPSSFSLADEVLRRCLDRDPKRRATIPELLAHPFLSGSKGSVLRPFLADGAVLKALRRSEL
ncbi:kinase-like domain-containing protein [Hyaloraphidium curvatum]|nr:kinase-like domain-containing protein [Hyaloraphidium curvatum]